MSKKLSGSQRRKLNKESELAREVLLSKVPKLTSYFNTSSSIPATEPEDTSNTVCDIPVPITSSQGASDSREISALPAVTDIETESGDNNKDEKVNLTLESKTDHDTSISKHVDSLALSGDPATWPDLILNEQRNDLILKYPAEFSKEDYQYPKNSNNRHFSNGFRFRFAENGEKVVRRWLVYSEKNDSAYCFCCRIFDPCSKSQFGHKMGFNNWKHMAERLKSHEMSPDHFKYMVQWCTAENRLKGGTSINQELINQINTETQRSEEVLRRIVEITLYLTEHNIAFRGSSSTLFTKGNGNFLGLVQLLGKFDAVLMEHLRRISNRETNFHLLSVSSQNEIINILGNAVKESIINKIKNAKYFSVIFDCTPDISRKEQTSLTIRYVNEENEEINIEESFIAYRVAEETSGEALTDLMFKEIAECGLKMKDCRGQGYDNGANMAGIHKGVQARVLADFPLAFFMPCGCHSLNLVIADGAKSSVKSTSLFGTLQRIYTIFAGSTKRWCLISEHVKDLTLKQVCETRWEARITSVQAVRYQYVEVRDALIELNEKTDDPKTASEANSLVNHMEDFSFLVCLLVWHDLLFEINIISKSLQGKGKGVSDAVYKFNNCLDFLDKFRENGYTNAVISARDIAEELEIQPIFPEKRIRRKKRVFLYESASDEVQSTAEDTFKREVFYPLVDAVTASVKSRSTAIYNHNSQWGFLYNLANLPPKDDLKQSCLKLETLLKNTDGISDINGNELFCELQHVNSILELNEIQERQVQPIDVLRAIKKTDSKDLFINLWIALRVLLTTPVTVASAERSFSKLKLIKTYLRSTMSQDRLNSLAIMSIENEEARKIDFKDILKTFARAKSRRMPF